MKLPRWAKIIDTFSALDATKSYFLARKTEPHPGTIYLTFATYGGSPGKFVWRNDAGKAMRYTPGCRFLVALCEPCAVAVEVPADAATRWPDSKP